MTTKKQFINSKGDTWEWEETPEITKAVARLHETIRQNKLKEHFPQKKVTLKF